MYFDQSNTQLKWWPYLPVCLWIYQYISTQVFSVRSSVIVCYKPNLLFHSLYIILRYDTADNISNQKYWFTQYISNFFFIDNITKKFNSYFVILFCCYIANITQLFPHNVSVICILYQLNLSKMHTVSEKLQNYDGISQPKLI